MEGRRVELPRLPKEVRKRWLGSTPTHTLTVEEEKEDGKKR